jgi:hypothetical protein
MLILLDFSSRFVVKAIEDIHTDEEGNECEKIYHLFLRLYFTQSYNDHLSQQQFNFLKNCTIR